MRPDRSIEQCAENIDSICFELGVATTNGLSVEELKSATCDLTSTQIAIPSHLSDCASESEEEQRSPTSIAPTAVTDLIEVILCTHSDEPPVVVQVPYNTSVNEVISAEGKDQSQNMQWQCCGFLISWGHVCCMII